MKEPKKSKIKKGFTWGAGLGGAAILGYLQGVGVEKVIAEQILQAMREGDIPRIVVLFAIFFMIWLEVHGMKKEVAKITAAVSSGFDAGEARFQKIEARAALLESVQLNLVAKIASMEHEGKRA